MLRTFHLVCFLVAEHALPRLRAEVGSLRVVRACRACLRVCVCCRVCVLWCAYCRVYAVFAVVRAFVRLCVRLCVCACVCACVRACVRHSPCRSLGFRVHAAARGRLQRRQVTLVEASGVIAARVVDAGALRVGATGCLRGREGRKIGAYRLAAALLEGVLAPRRHCNNDSMGYITWYFKVQEGGRDGVQQGGSTRGRGYTKEGVQEGGRQ